MGLAYAEVGVLTGNRNQQAEAIRLLTAAPQDAEVQVPSGTATLTITLNRMDNLAAKGWWSGDNHFHMNYAGVYHTSTPQHAAGESPPTFRVQGYDMLLRLADPVGDAFGIAARLPATPTPPPA